MVYSLSGHSGGQMTIKKTTKAIVTLGWCYCPWDMHLDLGLYNFISFVSMPSLIRSVNFYSSHLCSLYSIQCYICHWKKISVFVALMVKNDSVSSMIQILFYNLFWIVKIIIEYWNLVEVSFNSINLYLTIFNGN